MTFRSFKSLKFLSFENQKTQDFKTELRNCLEKNLGHLQSSRSILFFLTFETLLNFPSFISGKFLNFQLFKLRNVPLFSPWKIPEI